MPHDTDFHRAQVEAPTAADMHDVEAVPTTEIVEAQAAHGTSGDGRLRATKINSASLHLLFF